MIRIAVQNELAEKIRQAEGQIELVDSQGQPLGMIRRPPSEQEIAFAKTRIGTPGPKMTMDELIAKVEAL